MSPPTPTTNPTPEPGDDAPFYRRVLHELIDMGLDIARTLHAQVTTPTAPTATPATPHPESAATAFDRVARTVRRCVLLARKLSEPAPAHNRAATRRQLIRGVEDAIARTADGEHAEAVRAEFAERLDAPDLEDDIHRRPVADIVADIVRDLGLAETGSRPYYKRRRPADIAALCAQAAANPAAANPAAANPATVNPTAPGPAAPPSAAPRLVRLERLTV